MQRNIGLEPMEDPFIASVSQLTPPEVFEAKLRSGLPAWQKHLSADDYVEFCWHAPTVRLLAGRPRLRPPSPGYAYPNWTYNALGGLPAAVDPGLFVAAKTMALTLVDLATQPEVLAAAQAEFRERTGGGIGGPGWVGPLLPAISIRRSICAGRNMSPPRAARSGASPPRTPALARASRSDITPCQPVGLV